LIDLRLIEKRIRASMPINQHDKARYARYFLADPFLRFYYRMVEPNRSFVAQQIYEPILRNLTEQLRSFVAVTFEELCRTWTLHMGRAGQLPFIPEYVGSDWRGSEVQIDVMAVNWREEQVFIGEAKWGDSKVDHSIYKSLGERAPLAVVHMPSEKPWTVHLALFARKGYTPAVIQAAQADGVKLLTFEQIVSDLRRVPGRVIR
jgi:hypothetical protein